MTAYHIIIAEDDADQRAVLTQAVTLLYPAADVITVDNGTDALARFLAHGADVIITDQRMPGLIGSALVQQLRARNAHVPIILMSGLITNGMNAPDRRTYYLQKPASVQALAHVLHHILATT